MDNTGYRSLLVGKAGRLLDGLRCLVTAHPLLEKPLTANDIPSAMLLLDNFQPRILFLDASLSSNDRKACLRHIQEEHPSVKCIVIVNRNCEHAPCLAAGAHQVLLDGFPADSLFRAINNALAN